MKSDGAKRKRRAQAALDAVAGYAVTRALVAMKNRLTALGWSPESIGADAAVSVEVLQTTTRERLPAMILEMESDADAGSPGDWPETFVAWFVQAGMEVADARNAVHPAGHRARPAG
jgi:hypothetical protein